MEDSHPDTRKTIILTTWKTIILTIILTTILTTWLRRSSWRPELTWASTPAGKCRSGIAPHSSLFVKMLDIFLSTVVLPQQCMLLPRYSAPGERPHYEPSFERTNWQLEQVRHTPGPL